MNGLRAFLKLASNNENKQSVDDTESKSVVTHSSGSTMEQSQTIEFRDQGAAWTQSTITQPDSTFNIGLLSEMDLARFLARPVQIAQLTWTSNIGTSPFPGMSKAFILNPWKTFLSDPAVSDKIRTFRYLRSSLKVKFLVNGNGFLFGQMMVFYHPLYDYDDFKDYGTETAYGGGNTDKKHVKVTNASLIRHSQKPHIFLIPAISQGGTMELPFVWFRNFVDLTSGESSKLGRLLFYVLNPLTVNNKTTLTGVQCDVTVMAWMENPILSGPTSQTMLLTEEIEGVATSQSGRDEYGKQPVSDTANAIAASMGSLSNIPYIGPYARASSMISGALGGMAKLFGFSRPAIITNISPYKPVYLGNMANTDAGDTSSKLTFDSKQEVTIDPRVVGLSSTDEMSIAHIASKESYFCTSPWTAAATSSTKIMCIAVTPQLFKYGGKFGSGTQAEPIHLTACGYVTQPFLAWRGTMRYRFQVIASQFHRGKIRVAWDPIALKNSATNQFKSFNKVSSKIIDLENCRDFTVDVGWGQSKPYLPLTVRYGQTTQTTVQVEASNLEINKNAGFNGVIGLYVVNPLISSGDTYIPQASAANVQINCFVSCLDLVVANPSEEGLQIYGFSRSGNLLLADDNEEEEEVAVSQAGFLEEPESTQNAPTATNAISFELGPPIRTLSDGASTVFYGDPLLSIRTLMKRYIYYGKWPHYPDITATAINPKACRLRYFLPDYPLYQGEVTGSSEPFIMEVEGIAPPIDPGQPAQPKTKVKYNPVLTSFMNFFTPCFVCRRGGIRWKYTSEFSMTPQFNNSAKYNASIMTTLRVARCPSKKTPTVAINETAGSSPTDVVYSNYLSTPSGAGGQFVTQTSVQPTVEVELPFYNYNRFVPGFSKNIPTTTSFKRGEDDNDYSYHQVVLECVRADVTNVTGIEAFCAAADDYSLYFYIGPPVLYLIDDIKMKATSLTYDKLFIVKP